MESLSVNCGGISLPVIDCEISMIPFDLATLEGLPKYLKSTAMQMLENVKAYGVGFFTIHGKRLKKGETLRRGGPHTDGNYEKNLMSFGGGGWKVGQDGPQINTLMHERQYLNKKGGIILASNYEACLGWNGEYSGLPNTGGDCGHIKLDSPFLLKKNTVYYGNNHFIHESLPVSGDVHRVFARITLPEDHEYESIN